MSDACGGRLDNGLHALSYVALTDVDDGLGRHLLTALGRAHIPAYLDAQQAPTGQQRLFVAAEDRADARSVVIAAARDLNDDQDEDRAPAVEIEDPLSGIDTDAAFDDLVADWPVDTIAAIRDAERSLTREDAQWRSRLNRPTESDEVWLDEEHYVPPPPPPLPRLAAPTVLALLVLTLSVLLLSLGGQLGLGNGFRLAGGIVGILIAGAILFTRVRRYGGEDEQDDGSAL